MSFALALLLVVAQTSDSREQRSPAMRCKLACESHIKNPAVRNKVCARCLMGGSAGDRAFWVRDAASEEAAMKSALTDPDWAVRWAAVKAKAKTSGQAELSVLASWIMKAQGAEFVQAATTAAHVASSRKVTTAELLKAAGKDGPTAAARIWKERDSVRSALELELYGTDPLAQREALEHLAVFLSVSEGRAALEAMKTRPEGTDEIVGEVLRARAAAGATPAGRVLIQAGTAELKPFIDRLFAVFSRKINAIRPELSSADLTVKKNAMRELWNYGPLGSHDLEPLVADPDVSVRILAARALAAGEGRTLDEAARVRIGFDSQTPPASQARWIEIVGELGGKKCGDFLGEIANDSKTTESARGAAISALGACAGSKSLKTVMTALDSSSPVIRAGAVRALGYMPRNTDAEAAVAKALGDPDPEVLAAAVKTLGAQRQSGRLEQVQPLMEHRAPAVRAAAVEVVAALAGSKATIAIGKKLKNDPDPTVRAAAAKALGELGGPHAPGVLGEAAKNDPDSHVQHQALESLRRLGFR